MREGDPSQKGKRMREKTSWKNMELQPRPGSRPPLEHRKRKKKKQTFPEENTGSRSTPKASKDIARRNKEKRRTDSGLRLGFPLAAPPYCQWVLSV
jgi:hypothetical protein